MSSGFTSNYVDSGYTLTTNNWYNQNNLTVNSVSNVDIYYTTQQVGVYMINGGTSATTYPIFGSVSNMENIGVPNNSDDAWIIYPGFGFVLYDLSYNTQISRFYTNTSNVPVLFSFSNGGYSGRGTQIVDTNGNNTLSNRTNSIRVYFRGQEIGINGIYS